MAKNNNPSYEEVFWKVESKDTQIHGIDKPKIISAIEIEGAASSSGGSKILTFTRPSTDWSWNFSFEWFWFTPTKYDIVAWRNATWLACSSMWWYDSDWNEWCLTFRPNGSSQSETASSTSVLRVFYTNAWGGDTRASHNSFTADWIWLTFNASAENIKMRITAYT